jgi:polyisoprenoid-binding protein YceI
LSLALVLLSSFYSYSAAAADETLGGEYTLTRQYGSVFFKVFHQQYLNLVGRFDDYSGKMTLDPANLANSQLTATVKMTSLNMPDAETVETLVNSAGENEVDFHGDLSFVGKTLPWTFHVKFNPGEGPLGGSSFGILGTGTINRLDYGMNQYLNMAAEMVEIEVNAKFNKQ